VADTELKNRSEGAICLSSWSISRPTTKPLGALPPRLISIGTPKAMAISRNWPRRASFAGPAPGPTTIFALEAVMANESNIATLVPTKSDADMAAELKKRAIEVYEPVLQLLNEAHAAGFEIAVSSGLAPIGKHMITGVRVAKVY